MKYKKNYIQNLKASTLLEMVVALAVIVVVFAAIVVLFRNVQTSWASKAASAETVQNARVLMDHINRNLAKAVKIIAVSDSAETDGYIEFEDNDGNTLRYDIESSYIQFGPAAGGSDLAGPVSSLQFTCYDACDLDTPITNVNSIRFIEVQTTLLNSAPNSQDKTFTASAYLRTNWDSSSDSDPNLIAYWPLDGDAMDLSGNGNHGTIYGSVSATTDRNSNSSSAMSFGGGAGDKIDVGDPSELRLTGEMTLMAWVYLNSSSTRNGRVISKMALSGQRSWSLNIENSWSGVSKPGRFIIASDGSNFVGVNDDVSLPQNQWVHMAGVYKPGTYMRLYLNGDLAREITSGVPASQFSNNGKSILIGNRNDAGDCGWVGSLDEVRIYNEALTEAEIEVIMIGTNLPGTASNPNPNNGVSNVWLDADLSWTVGSETTSHDVYFGETSPGTFQGNQAGTTFAPGTMNNNTTYYWRIDEVNTNGTTTGTVWSFTTGTSTPQLLNAGFEYPDVTGFEYDPSGSDWTPNTVGYFAIADSGSVWGNTAYEGNQNAALQRSISISQAVSGFEIGRTYTVTWAEADRPSGGGNDFRVWLDSTEIYALHTAASTSWELKTSTQFTATSTTHTLKFEAINTGGGDKSVFIDAISIDGQ